MAAALPASSHGPGPTMGGGKPGDAAKVTRVIEVIATDNAFSLKALKVSWLPQPTRHPRGVSGGDCPEPR